MDERQQAPSPHSLSLPVAPLSLPFPLRDSNVSSVRLWSAENGGGGGEGEGAAAAFPFAAYSDRLVAAFPTSSGCSTLLPLSKGKGSAELDVEVRAEMDIALELGGRPTQSLTLPLVKVGVGGRRHI